MSDGGSVGDCFDELLLGGFENVCGLVVLVFWVRSVLGVWVV